MSEEMTKEKLINEILQEHERFEETVVKLTKDQMIDPSLEGGWSVKDILAHVSVWESVMIEWLEKVLKSDIPEQLAQGISLDDLDELNNRFYSENQNKSLSLILSEFQASFPKAVQTVEDTPEIALIDPNHFKWRNGNPLWKIVAANTYEHYEEHGEQIITWTESSSTNNN
jgi:hypothetical protein